MSQSAPGTSKIDPAAQLDIEVEEAITLCGGDTRSALRATLIANMFLQSEVDRLADTVSSGFARGHVRRRPGTTAPAKKKSG